MEGLYNVYIPICGLLIAALCNIIFLLKKELKIKKLQYSLEYLFIAF